MSDYQPVIPNYLWGIKWFHLMFYALQKWEVWRYCCIWTKLVYDGEKYSACDRAFKAPTRLPARGLTAHTHTPCPIRLGYLYGGLPHVPIPHSQSDMHHLVPMHHTPSMNILQAYHSNLELTEFIKKPLMFTEFIKKPWNMGPCIWFKKLEMQNWWSHMLIMGLEQYIKPLCRVHG